MRQKNRKYVTLLLGAGVPILVWGNSAYAQDASSAFDSLQASTDTDPVSVMRASSARTRSAPRFPSDGTDEIAVLAMRATGSPPWIIKADLGGATVSNPDKIPGGSKDALRLAPSLSVGWQASYGELNIGIGVNAGAEAYNDNADAGSSLVGAQFSAGLRDRNEKIAFSASYAPSRLFKRFYSDGIVTLHNMTVGAGRTFTLEKSAEHSANFSVDLSYTRREASAIGFQQNQFTALGKFSGSSGRMGWAVQQRIQRRIFTNSASSGRGDWNYFTSGEINYGLSSVIILRLAFNLEINDSNVKSKQFNNFDIGPKLSAAWKF